MKIALLAILMLIAAEFAFAGSNSWQTAVSLASKGKTAKAYEIFETLLKSADDDHRDEILMNMARIKYQYGKLDEAIKLYNRVSKDSDFWLESIEEKAWALIRQEKYEKALGLYHTLATPAFSAQVGPETYLIGAFAALKICDYKTVFEIFKDFKSKYKPLSGELEKLAKTGQSSATARALDQLKSNPELAWADLGGDVVKLPRFLNRDGELVKVAKSGNSALASQRIKVLASKDVNDLSKITQKLHIIEVEAIQRMNLAQKKPGHIVRDSEEEVADAIDFPKEDEVWLDEVEHYHVNAKGCAPREVTKL